MCDLYLHNENDPQHLTMWKTNFKATKTPLRLVSFRVIYTSGNTALTISNLLLLWINHFIEAAFREWKMIAENCVMQMLTQYSSVSVYPQLWHQWALHSIVFCKCMKVVESLMILYPATQRWVISVTVLPRLPTLHCSRSLSLVEMQGHGHDTKTNCITWSRPTDDKNTHLP